MGCVGSVSVSSQASKDEKTENKKISQFMTRSAMNDQNVKKILLLGAGESGKSTIFKQMKILYKDGSFEDAEREGFRNTVHGNVIESMKALISHANSTHPSLFTPTLSADTDTVMCMEAFTTLTPESGAVFKRLWESEPIQRSFNNRSSIQVMDNCGAFLADIDRIADPLFVPTLKDILMTRVRTSGIADIFFECNNVNFRLFDVGGQRSERRKWIHCFDNCDAVLFVVALSEYDQNLFENPDQNRMQEALNVFSEICNSRFFINTDMILFLNKRDLFLEKIARVPLSQFYPEFEGGSDYDKGCDFLRELFVSQNRSPSKKIFTHVTCATDTNNIEFVFKAVQTTIISRNLEISGFI